MTSQISSWMWILMASAISIFCELFWFLCTDILESRCLLSQTLLCHCLYRQSKLIAANKLSTYKILDMEGLFLMSCVRLQLTLCHYFMIGSKYLPLGDLRTICTRKYVWWGLYSSCHISTYVNFELFGMVRLI